MPGSSWHHAAAAATTSACSSLSPNCCTTSSACATASLLPPAPAGFAWPSGGAQQSPAPSPLPSATAPAPAPAAPPLPSSTGSSGRVARPPPCSSSRIPSSVDTSGPLMAQTAWALPSPGGAADSHSTSNLPSGLGPCHSARAAATQGMRLRSPSCPHAALNSGLLLMSQRSPLQASQVDWDGQAGRQDGHVGRLWIGPCEHTHGGVHTWSHPQAHTCGTRCCAAAQT